MLWWKGTLVHWASFDLVEDGQGRYSLMQLRYLRTTDI